MTTEEKAKAYDNVREKIAIRFGSNVAKEIFSEYEESEDERIRKAIYTYLKNELTNTVQLTPRTNEFESWLSWLEKKGENRPVISADALREGIAHFGITQYQIDSWLKKYVDVEKQGENTPADKVEPKFHEGEWVIYNNDICQIVKREEGCNKLVTVFGIEKELVNERNLSTARLWTIADAKDGDVLVMQKTNITYESIFIFNKIENNRIIQYLQYFTTDAGEEVCEERSIGGFLGFVGTTVHPATNEQREALFSAMHEAGYLWNAEELKLEKIEQKQEWSEEDLISLDYLATFVDENGDSFYGKNKPNVVKWIRSFANLNPTQKQEWSEFDAKMLARAMRAVNYFITNDDHDEANQCFSWLKSLKDRYAWKPSDEQMSVLKEQSVRKKSTVAGAVLCELFHDLEKLREE